MKLNYLSIMPIFEQYLHSIRTVVHIQWRRHGVHGGTLLPPVTSFSTPITAAALSTLQRRAYDHYLELSDERDEELEFDDWCQQKAKMCPQFDYWATVLQLELTVLVNVCSLRQGSFQVHLDALPACDSVLVLISMYR